MSSALVVKTTVESWYSGSSGFVSDNAGEFADWVRNEMLEVSLPCERAARLTEYINFFLSGVFFEYKWILWV